MTDKNAHTGFSPEQLKAPVIIDHLSRAATAPLVSFMQQLAAADVEDVAIAEAERLKNYFVAYSRSLQGENTPVDKDFADDLTKPGALSRIFTGMARATRNVIVSDVAILPDRIIYDGPVQHLIADDNFVTDFRHGRHKFGFGFFRVTSKDPQRNKYNNVSVPVLYLDHHMLQRAADTTQGDVPLREMLGHLKTMMGVINHDALHQLTAPIITDAAVVSFDASSQPAISSATETWAMALPDDYETWAHVAHEKTVLSMLGGNLTGLKACIDRYFDRLADIAADPLQAETKIHDMVDFFGIVMAHTLSRLVPVHHPAMQHCLDRLYAIDPQPDRCLDDYLVSSSAVSRNNLRAMDTTQKIEKAQAFASYYRDKPPHHRNPDRSEADLHRIMNGYEAAGFSLVPQQTDTPRERYGRIKALQLIGVSLEDVYNHAPMPHTDTPLEKLRQQAVRHSKDMLKAAVTDLQSKGVSV